MYQASESEYALFRVALADQQDTLLQIFAQKKFLTFCEGLEVTLNDVPLSDGCASDEKILSIILEELEPCVAVVLQFISFVPSSLLARIVELYSPYYAITIGKKAGVTKK